MVTDIFHTIVDNETPSSAGAVTGITVLAPPLDPAIMYDNQDRLLAFGSKSFTYNVMGNLKQVVLPSKTVNYKVDAFNRRVIKLNGATVENL